MSDETGNGVFVLRCVSGGYTEVHISLLIYVFRIRNYPEVRHWTDTLETINGQLDKCTTTAKDVNELLRVLWCAQWPETATYTTCHDYNMIISHFVY